MDLSKLEIPDTITVHLEFPNIGKLYGNQTEKKDPVTIELYSPASPQAIAYSHKVQKEVLGRIGKKGLKALRKSGEEFDEQEIDRLMAFTANVSNLTYKGKLITKDTLREVYSDPKMGWICDQLSDRLGGWTDFLG